MKGKLTNNKHCQFTVISDVISVTRTKLRSPSLTFYYILIAEDCQYTKSWTNFDKQLLEQDDLFPQKLARQMIGH